VGAEWLLRTQMGRLSVLGISGRVMRVYLRRSPATAARYFPDLVTALLRMPSKRFVLDGEIVIPVSGRLSFDELLLRIHPAVSRVRKLAAEHPAMMVLFDLLVDEKKQAADSHGASPSDDRGLEAFARAQSEPIGLRSDCRRSRNGWRRRRDGSRPRRQFRRHRRQSGSICRTALASETRAESSHRRTTADCVVGGFRYAEARPGGGSLLLGLTKPKGKLHHVGFTSSFTAAERKRITPIVESLERRVHSTVGRPAGLAAGARDEATHGCRFDRRA